jgi:hypothetical protein
MNPLLPLDYLILLGLGIAALVVWLGLRGSGGVSTGGRVLIIGLRLLAVACLLLIALNPGRWETLAEPRDAGWAILVDDSASMAVEDGDGGQSRLAVAQNVLNTLSTRAERLSIPLDSYSYSGQLRRISEGSPLVIQPEEEGTQLTTALEELLRRTARTEDLAGVIIIGDGREVPPVPPENLLMAARARGVPLSVVPLGGVVELPDIAVDVVPRRLTVFADQPIALGYTVSSTGLEPLSTTIELRLAGGSTIAKQALVLTPGKAESGRFEMDPLPPGYHELHVQVPPYPGERDPLNNTARVGVLVLEGQLNVLMVEGSPHWDSKFIVQLLRELPYVDLTTVHRVTGERFFRVEPGQSRPAQSQQAIFPDSLEILRQYDLVIFGRGVEYFVTPEKANLLSRYVTEHGGALVFTRGQAWEGDLGGLTRLMPLELGSALRTPVRWQPTLAGEQEGFFGYGLPAWRDPVWQRLPELEGVRESLRLAPFAQVLVEGQVPGSSRTAPLLISRRVGQGLVTLVNAEGLWKWDFFPELAEAKVIYRDFWAQLFQWAATYSDYLPGQDYALRLSRSEVEVGEPVRIFVSSRGELAAKGPAPILTVWQGDTEVARLGLAEDPRQPGLWQSFLEPEAPGFYRIAVTSAQDDALPSAMQSLVVRGPMRESENLSADRVFLETLAQTTGGKIWSVDGVNNLWDEVMLSTHEQGGNLTWIPRWDTGWFLVIIGLLFSFEWWYRRRNGLS